MQPDRPAPGAPGNVLLKPSFVLNDPRIAAGSAPKPRSAREVFDGALAGIASACAAGRRDGVSQAARTAMPLVASESARGMLLRQLAELQSPEAGESPAVGEERLWLLRQIDGRMIGLYRLRANGEVGLYPPPETSRWSLQDGTLRLLGLGDEVTTEFRVHGRHQGRQVFVGLGDRGAAVQVLSEVNCFYSKLRMLDPEMLGALATAMQSEPMPDFGMPAVPAVIVAAPRTGSHLLLNLLNSTGRVFFDAELFNFEKISVFGADLPARDTRALGTLRWADPVQFAKVMMTRSHHLDGRMLDNVPVRGFKLFPEHSPVVMNWAMDEPAVRIVHLHRPNLLAEFCSLLVATQHGHWVGGPESLKQLRIRFDAERFVRFVDGKRGSLEKLRSRLASRGGPHTEIAYEGSFARDHLNRVLSFLTGTPGRADFGDLGIKRQLSENILERFDNPDAVATCLARIGAEQWADCESAGQ